MRTSFHILALAIFLVFAGCAEAPRSVPKETFFGILPCADCPDIHYKITLHLIFAVNKR
ncbi:MAG TPA: copper resistance protein NlpE N-terminal domain-containing protein [Pricia sp.]|nr:copper resistance protein NlpE N-terminal domain-containing protein [Pricia sp.]